MQLQTERGNLALKAQEKELVCGEMSVICRQQPTSVTGVAVELSVGLVGKFSSPKTKQRSNKTAKKKKKRQVGQTVDKRHKCPPRLIVQSFYLYVAFSSKMNLTYST